MSQSFNKHNHCIQLPIMNIGQKPRQKNSKLLNETAEIYLQTGSKNRFNANYAPLRNRNNYDTLKTINRKSIEISGPKNATIQANPQTTNQRIYYKRNSQNVRKIGSNRRYEEQDQRGSASKSPYLKMNQQGKNSSLNKSSNKIRSSNHVRYSNNLGTELYKQPRSSLSQHYQHYQTSLHKRRVSMVNNGGTGPANQINSSDRNYILEEAKEHYKNNRYDKAGELLKKYVKFNNNCVEAYYFLGMSLINSSEISLGVQYLEQVIQSTPNFKKSLYLVIALAYKRLNKLEEAIEILSKGLTVFPDYYDCMIYRGKIYLKISKLEQAIKDFDKAIKINDKKGFAYLGKGTALKDSGKLQEAIKVFSQGISTDMKQGCLQKRGLCFYEQKKYELALKDFESCQSSSFTLSHVMGLCYYNINRPIQAILCFQQSLKNDSNQESITSSVEMMMRIKIQDKDFYEAYHILNRASSFEINKNVIEEWRIFLQGVLFMMKKKYREGIGMLRQFICLPNYDRQYNEIENLKNKERYAFLKPMAHLYKAFGELSESNIDGAKEDYKDYDIIMSRIGASEQNLSKIYNSLIIETGQKFPKDCLHLLEEASNLISNKPEPYLFLAFQCVQNRLEQFPDKKDENTEYIIENLTKGISHLPQLSNNHISSFFYYRAVIYLYKGDFNKAVSDVDKAIQKSEDNIPKYFYLRGLIFAIFGNFSQAVQDLSVAISLDEKYAKPFLQRAKCLQIQGNSNQAFLDLQKYITLAPEDPYIHKYAGFLLFQNCAYQDCLAAFSHGNDEISDHQMLLTKAKCHFLLNNTEKCLELFKQYQQDTLCIDYSNDIKLITICDSINNSIKDNDEYNEYIQKVDGILEEITNQQQQCKIFKIRDMHQIMASIMILKSNYTQAIDHLKYTLHYFREQKKREQEKQFIDDQQQFEDQWSEVQIQYNLAIVYLCQGKFVETKAILKQFQNSVERGKYWKQIINLVDSILNSDQKSLNQLKQKQIELDVFEQNHRISKNWPKIKVPGFKIYLSMAFSYPFVQPPQMLPQFDESLFNEFHINKVENKPEAPWINRQEKGLVFTPNIQVFDNLELSVTTKKNNEQFNDSQKNKPISEIDHSVELSNSDFQMEAEALKQKFKLDSLVQMRLKKLMDKKNNKT